MFSQWLANRNKAAKANSSKDGEKVGGSGLFDLFAKEQKQEWEVALQEEWSLLHPQKKGKPLEKYVVNDYHQHRISKAKHSKSKKKREKHGYRTPGDMAEQLWHRKEFDRHAIGYSHGHVNTMVHTVIEYKTLLKIIFSE